MTLIEQFIQEEYEAFLEQEESRQLVEIYKNHKAILEAFDAYNQLVELQEEYKDVSVENLQEGDLSTALAGLVTKVSDAFSKATPLLVASGEKNGKDAGYSYIGKDGNIQFIPEAPKKPFSYKKIDSVVGFINGIIAWIKNVLINVINFLTRGIRGLLGLSNGNAEEYKKEKRSTDPFGLISKAKKVAAIERQYGFGTIKVDASDYDKDGKKSTASAAKKFDDVLGGYIEKQDAKELITAINEASSFGNIIQSLTAQRNPALYFDTKGTKKTNYVLDTDKDGKVLTDKDNKPIYKAIETYEKSPVSEFVNVDLSKDLSQLKILLIKFFDLYDDAVGTNGEKLFDTTDLDMLFKSLSRIFINVQDGNLDNYAYYGKLIDANKIKDNYNVTNNNIQNLSNIFNQVETTIKNLLLNLNVKAGIAATYDPNKFILLSSLTFKQLSDIASLVLEKSTEVNNMQHKLEALGKSYEKLVKELDKVKQSWISIGTGVTVQTEFERAVSDLYSAAKYSFQTLMLRFTALVNYNAILNETYDLVKKLATVNRNNAKDIKKQYDSIKNAKFPSNDSKGLFRNTTVAY